MYFFFQIFLPYIPLPSSLCKACITCPSLCSLSTEPTDTRSFPIAGEGVLAKPVILTLVCDTYKSQINYHLSLRFLERQLPRYFYLPCLTEPRPAGPNN